MNLRQVMLRVGILSLGAVLSLTVFSLATASTRPFADQIGPPVIIPENTAVARVKDAADLKTRGLELLIPDLPAQDEILLQEDRSRAFIAAMDGYIWIADLATNEARRFVRVPLLAGGMVAHPANPDLIYFCVSRAAVDDSVADNGPGVYELTISAKTVRRIGVRVPKIPRIDERRMRSDLGVFYANEPPTLRFSEMTEHNSRAVEKADDLAISRDGERIYFTEPYDHPNAILGVSVQSRNEALSLGKNGNLWMFDLKANTASLIAHDYAYLDGILLEYGASATRETSILVNELSMFRLLRLHLSGERAGEDDIVIEGLPGFPDGMDRDPQGRIWIAFPVERSGLLTWLHQHPFWKRLALRIPERWQPVSRRTGLLALSPDGAQALYYGVHDGSLFSTLIVAVPGRDRIYLAVYEKNYRGLHVTPYPL